MNRSSEDFYAKPPPQAEEGDKQHDDSSSDYSDYHESPNDLASNHERSSIFQANFSAFTDKSAPPFSAFNTSLVNADFNREYAIARFSSLSNLDKDKFAEQGVYDIYKSVNDQYPTWNHDSQVPIEKQEIQAIFSQLTDVFGFQEDNMKNMYDYFMKLLDSRASRMGTHQSLRTLHADYIGGVNSNFRKWYFASQLDIDDTIGFENAKSNGTPKSKFLKSQDNLKHDILSLGESQNRWSQNMSCLSALDCVVQVALYLLIWGEANNIRFMPECICFLFKCCNDYFYSINFNETTSQATELPFMDHLITPLYDFYHKQSFTEDGVTRKDKDHSSVIGYDDMNQLFWYRKGLERIVVSGKRKLMDVPSHERYLMMNEVVWNKVFYKTYRETRTWLHLLTNFNRIWIIHVSVFWLYTALNSKIFYTANYRQSVDNQPTLQTRLSAMAISGPLALLINIFALLCEYFFVPRRWPGSEPIFKKIVLTSILFALLISPSIYIFGFRSLNHISKFDEMLALCQLICSILTIIYFSIVPLGSLFGNSSRKHGRKYLPNQYFTASIHSLTGKNLLASYGLWFLVFGSKFLESYFFLTLSLTDPIRELANIKGTRCTGDAYLGNFLCTHEAMILLALMLITDLVMFFLDTYLWYIFWNTMFSLCCSFHVGISIWTPWRNIFSRLPKRISSKVLASNRDDRLKGKVLISAIWNSILVSMYREHLLSMEIIQKLMYLEVTNPNNNEAGEVILKEPRFFVSQEDLFTKMSLFESQSEAQRRITFFAQSLATPIPEPMPISMMPTFTVLIPHYGEKIILSLKEIIREEDEYSHITLLEYLKQLHPEEWLNFVEDTKLLANANTDSSSSDPFSSAGISKYEDLAYYCIGFKSSNPEYILRTRIWASLRTQTLYRTISGFMNYHRAIKLLYDSEAMSLEQVKKDEDFQIEQANRMALRKSRIVVAMQRLNRASPGEREDVEFILRAYPEVQIAYIEEEHCPLTNITEYFSCLIDGSCEILENGYRNPKYKIRLSGNPILGDGKSDNQNHSLIFTRGEYLQLIDANQDNYLEECLKIRSVLAEFEEMMPPNNPYAIEESQDQYKSPVAIIGTREYIFSENIGVLGDVAAAKEQTFGTLFARTLAQIGGKLHYGHPDFLNTLFMTTRGGVSKAQKGLHLNEDVYAGMNVLLRGGRIKHCEYMQCGKGRDLGFGSILNFTTKIGSGMGEQILSREYFYIGTHASIDRFLSIYYAHLGFHLNNIFIFTSIKLFILVCLHMAVLSKNTVICEYDKNIPITDPRRPSGCSNLMPVIQWLQNYIISITLVFGISFLPLIVQEITERGILRALTRLAKHFGSMSPFFEVFICKIYAQSMINDLRVGGARYIATGRSFATTRVPFITLYSRFASESIYFGAAKAFLLLYSSLNMWNIPLLYLWYTIAALCLSPFLFNPNQFLWDEFFLDYHNFLVWISSGNSKYKEDNWTLFVRGNRSQVTGSKRKVNRKNVVEKRDFKRPYKVNLIITDIIPQFCWTLIITIGYLYLNAQNEVRNSLPSYALLRLAICSIMPIAINAIVLLIGFFVSLLLGPIVSAVFKGFPAIIAAICHISAIVSHAISFEIMLLTQNFNFSLTLLGVCNCILIQSLLFKIITVLFLSRETKYDASNRAWWSGKWVSAGLEWHIITQPAREYVCKIIEMSMFTVDFLLGHMLLFVQIPIIMLPYIDKWHSLILMWLKPGRQFKPRILSKKEQRRRRMVIYVSIVIFTVICLVLSSVVVVPYLMKSNKFNVNFLDLVPEPVLFLVQPEEQPNNRKGLQNYRSLYKRG